MNINISAYSLRQVAQRLAFNLGACALAMLIFPSHAFAQVYKCTFKDEATRQNKVVYSDSPCGKAEKQTLTAIQAKVATRPTSTANNTITASKSARLGSDKCGIESRF